MWQDHCYRASRELFSNNLSCYMMRLPIIIVISSNLIGSICHRFWGTVTNSLKPCTENCGETAAGRWRHVVSTTEGSRHRLRDHRRLSRLRGLLFSHNSVWWLLKVTQGQWFSSHLKGNRPFLLVINSNLLFLYYIYTFIRQMTAMKGT